ncbi:hypothetical protein [Streptomyces bungoensis]|uniref:hypothetical protein n=1 Tax=Streptomyces bungoensis TaxID=285568 RepID=UPI0033EF2E19
MNGIVTRHRTSADDPARPDGAAAPPVTSRPPLWTRLSIVKGNVIQTAGLAMGATLIASAVATSGPGAVRFALALLGYLMIYDCCHSLGHYLAGRMVGIRFRFYGIRGTDHPEDYPFGMRQLMSVVPFWTVVTDKESMRAARPWQKAWMFAAGENATNLCSLLAAYAAMVGGVPGGKGLFVFTVIWDAVSSVMVTIKPKGDYAKALRALRGGRTPSAPARPMQERLVNDAPSVRGNEPSHSVSTINRPPTA